jgi:hypothetical protein
MQTVINQWCAQRDTSLTETETLIEMSPGKEFMERKAHQNNEPGSFRKASSILGSMAAAVVLASISLNAAHAQGDVPLLFKSDLVYKGAFKVPRGGDQNNTFSYGGNAVAYNPNNNSLYLTGHSSSQRTAEISIPAIVNSQNEADLQTATILQGFRDATEGRLNQINPSDSNDQRIGGQLVFGGKLYVGAFSYYDANGTQSGSHFVRPLDLSLTGQVVGPVAVGNDVHFTGGYMATIPPAWQAAFGGPALTGNCCKSIISVHSWGPAVSVFDPSNVNSGNSVPATDLVYYNSEHQLGPGETTQNPLFNLTTRVDGVVFPAGSGSVLFFGHHGIGPYCYGDGAECGDPTDSSKGTHAYPYVYQVWAYDANELLAVKNGIKQPYDVRPYDVWTFNVPFESDNEHDTGGVAYDPATGRIFFVQSKFGSDRLPLIHVFQVNAGPRPASPDNLIAQ